MRWRREHREPRHVSGRPAILIAYQRLFGLQFGRQNRGLAEQDQADSAVLRSKLILLHVGFLRRFTRDFDLAIGCEASIDQAMATRIGAVG